MKRAPLRRASTLTRSKPLRRSSMRRKPTRVKAGYEPKYRVFVRQFPCAVCGRRGPSQFCHERLKGTGLGLKGPDERAFPGCAPCHQDYDQRKGVFEGLDNDAREAWLDPIVLDLRGQYRDAFGAEPELREKIAS